MLTKYVPVPSELEIISVWPGKTLGGFISLSHYGSGFSAEYSELIEVSLRWLSR